jgi:hypothetical protein
MLVFEKMIITLFFLEKRQFCRRKLAKIAENNDHNIDPWFRQASVKIVINIHNVLLLFFPNYTQRER